MRRMAAWCLGSLLACPVLGSNWQAGSATGEGGESAVDCGAGAERILGSAGLLKNWRHCALSNKSLTSENGECGVEWTLERYEACDANQVTEDSFCRHVYVRDMGNQKTRIKVTLSANTSGSGSATIKNPNDPQWWWNPTVNIHDALPSVTLKRDFDGEEWAQGWSNIENPYDHITIRGTGGQGGPGSPNNPPPTATLTADRAANEGGQTWGGFSAWTDQFGNEFSGKGKIIIEYHVYTSADTTADNCKIGTTPWRVVLTSTMTSWCDVDARGNP